MYTFKDHLILEAALTGELKSDAQRVISTGLNKMLKLDAPASDSPEDQESYTSANSRVVDAFDMMEALEVIRKMFEESERDYTTPIETKRGESDTSKGWRKGESEMDIARDVKEAVHSYFMVGGDDKEGMLKRRKYRSLVMLVLDPLVNLFKGKEPQEIFDNYNEIIDNAIKYVQNSDIVSHPDDAFVVRKQIAREVKRAADVRKAVAGIVKLRKAAKGKAAKGKKKK